MADKFKGVDFGKRGRPRGWTPVCAGDHYDYCPTCRQWYDTCNFSDLHYHEEPDHKPPANAR